MVEEEEFIFYAIHMNKIFLNSVEIVCKISSRLLKDIMAFVKQLGLQHLWKETDESKSQKIIGNSSLRKMDIGSWLKNFKKSSYVYTMFKE